MDIKKIRLFSLVCFISFLVASFSVRGENQTWKVNLKDADIRAFVTQIADITGYSFIIDPRVKGKVTVISNAPMTREEIYEMFLSVLNVHGAAAIPTEEAIKIVMQNSAKQSAQNTSIFKKIPQEQLVTRVIKVKNANALALVPILRPMVAKYGHLAGVAAANALIISDHVNNIERIRKIVGELDSPSNSELEVVQLREAWVSDMVKLLEELEPKELGKSSSKYNRKFSVVADERSNRLILKGDENFRNKMRQLIAKLDQPAAVSGTTKVIHLRHADAEKLAELLKGLMGDIVPAGGSKKGQVNLGTGKVSIFPDEGLNALVVRAEPSLMQEIEAVIEQLDVRRAQVLIEAAIVEISDSLSRQLGVQIVAGDLSGESGPIGLTNFTNVGLSAAAVLQAIAVGSSTTGNVNQDIGAIGIGEQNSSGAWGVLIQALAGSGQANLLSTPSIITMDNQQSEIIVGQNVPFKTGETGTGTDGTSNPFTTIERQDVGLTLRVTPSVSEGDLVRLEIEQESSTISTVAVAGAADLVTNKRMIKTSVLADNAETIVLGGLMSENAVATESKIPFLGDIPVIGALFRSTSVSREKQNLLVILRPTILRNKAEARAASDSKYQGLWELNLELKRGRDGEESTNNAVRPDINDFYKGNQFLR